MQYRYNKIVIGGTFDLLHTGHSSFITEAFSYARHVIIGLTSDRFNNERGKKTFEFQNIRHKNLESFLQKKGYTSQYTIHIIDDICGPAARDNTIEAVLATADTLPNVLQVNAKRLENKINELEVVPFSFKRNEEGEIISSSKIRGGQMDLKGQYYLTKLIKIADKKFDDTVRAQLKIPFGKVIDTKKIAASDSIITVGDITTQKVIQQKITLKLAIVDFSVQRKPTYSSIKELGFKQKDPDFIVENPPGSISKSLIVTIDKVLKSTKNNVVLVMGEEDLAVIPVVLLSPFGTQIFYGQPDVGMIEVCVDQKIKSKVCKILDIES